MTVQVLNRTGKAEVVIWGEIQSDSAATFDRDLKALGRVDTLSIRINSPGGDVFQASGMYQMLVRHSASKTVFIEGVAASAASMIAMAGDKIMMAEASMMMVHDPSGAASGGRAEMERMSTLLFGVKQQMVRIYARRSGQPEDRVIKMMADETWMTAEEAVRLGFADAVEGQISAAAVRQMAEFDLSSFKDAPVPKTLEELTARYWSQRGKAASVDAAAQIAVEGQPEDDDTSDLVVKELDVDAIWARFNGKGGVK